MRFLIDADLPRAAGDVARRHGHEAIDVRDIGLRSAKDPKIAKYAQADDGARILVDRLWPRGLRKDEAKIDLWLQDVAPSEALRKWFAHDPKKWGEFKRRYFAELNGKPELLEPVYAHTKTGVTTLLFGAKDEKHNNAVALKEFIETK